VLKYINVVKEYGATRAVNDVTLGVERGEICVLLGQSGCGKSTLLRMANRLIDPSSGTVLVDRRDVATGDPVELRRRIGYVIQNVGLLPHRSVAENVGLTPSLLGMDRAGINERVDAMLELVRLDPGLYRDRFPAELSGGEAQRVGVARALAANPPLVLMDEPFGAVDPINRSAIRSDFVALHRKLGGTVLFVSHDVGEALAIADRIALMRDGRIVMHDTPTAILASRDSFVAEFFGNPDDLLLDLLTASLAVTHGSTHSADSYAIPGSASLRTALHQLVRCGNSTVTVIDEHGNVLGVVTLESIHTALTTTQQGKS